MATERYERPNGRIGVRTVFSDDVKTEQSKTQQHYKKRCDVNDIVARAFRVGVIDPQDVRESKLNFGSFEDSVSFEEAMCKIADAKSDFALLPAKVRAKFGNDPAQLLAFIGDDKNYQEAKDLGLLAPSKIEAREQAEREQAEAEAAAKAAEEAAQKVS